MAEQHAVCVGWGALGAELWAQRVFPLAVRAASRMGAQRLASTPLASCEAAALAGAGGGCEV